MKKRNFRTHRPLFTSPVPASMKSAKIKWKILPIFWMAMKRLAMTLGFLMIFNFVLMLFVLPILLSGEVAPSLPDKIVLYADLKEGLAERADQGGFMEAFDEKPMTLRALVDALDGASYDKRVEGLVVRMRAGSYALSQVQELRAAVKRFEASGKFAYIYSSSYGEGGLGLSRYYLASAFDEIWMQPLGVVSIPGVHAEAPYLRGALDKLGVYPDFFQRKDYKTAYENMTAKHMSRYSRETYEALIGDIRDEILADVPAERGISAEAFLEMVDKGLFSAQEAQEVGLITHADYGDVLLDHVAMKLTGVKDAQEIEENFVSIERYASSFSEHRAFLLANMPEIALIYVAGAIVPDSDGGGFGGGSSVAAASEIAPAILKASRDEKVKAIVLRVDSPGGSPSASESILRAVEKAKERGKTVIVSMGSAAASGGYWVSAYADRIFAMPTTLTGSIGVVGGKFSIGELSKKLGVNWDGVSWGENAGMWAVNSAFSESEAEQMNAMLDNVYEQFLARVSKGRGMSVEQVDQIAGGRVWTGKAALEVGLVDELGGLDKALDYTAKLIGAPNRMKAAITVRPKPKTALEMIAELLEGQVMMGQALKMQSEAFKAFAPAAEMIRVQSAEPVAAYEALRLQ
ncbi:MAG: signal peptide peptidase SppA [Micavibrio sp.]|nr:signal peptide peptidase SppA [Micavibrio sp.]